MLYKQKTHEEKGAFAGSEMMFMAEREKGTRFPLVAQEKCVRCPYFPGKGYACNLVPCPFTEPGACAACIHFLPVNEHRRKARCVWTGERLDAGEVERVRECIGFERREEGLTSGPLSGMVSFPNLERRHKRLSSLPRAGKSLVAYSVIHAPAGTVSGGRYVHIGRVATSSIREDWRLLKSRGELHPASSFNPQILEVPHV